VFLSFAASLLVKESFIVVLYMLDALPDVKQTPSDCVVYLLHANVMNATSKYTNTLSAGHKWTAKECSQKQKS